MRAWKFGACAVTAGVALSLTAPAVANAGGPPATTYVSTAGKSSNSGKSCASAKYAKIADGVAAAPAWSTVIVCPGTYNKGAQVIKPLRLSGYGATVNASGQENGIWVTSSHVTVAGFTLKNANGEGLLAGIDSFADIKNLPLTNPVLTDILVTHVKALFNDRGFNGTEMGNCKYPGDCGGGIHLNVVSHSMVSFSTVVGNADGILLTDDYGPNFRNFIVNNLVTDNTTECGIVLASHASNAVTFDPTFKVTKINPTKGGLYDNAVLDNTSLRNGTAKAPPKFGGGGSGSGIGIFGSGPGSAAYNNLVSGNYAAGNGLAGFTIHAHHPGGEDVNGNSVINNVFGRNNVGGDGYDGPPVVDFQTTGLAVFSVPPVKMIITGNKISNNAIGVWLSKTVNAQGLASNGFSNVTTKVVRG